MMDTKDALGAFTSLERRYYTSPEIFDLELERVISSQWILFAHVSEIQDARDVLVKQLGTESILVTRDDDGALHGFFNVCRHRGSQICDSSAHGVRRLLCPYHQWAYGLDGRLLAAPDMGEGLKIDREKLGLKKVHLEVWRGFIYVAFGPEAPRHSIADSVAEVDRHFEVFDLECLRLAHHITYDVHCNWKLLVENFLECYHCPGSHPELCKVMTIPDPEKVHDDIPLVPTSRPSMGTVLAVRPARGAAASYTLSGAPASSRLLGRVAEQPKSPPNAVFTLYPTVSYVGTNPDYVMTHRMLPVAPDRTMMICDWFVRADAQEGRDYKVEDVIALWDLTNRQDIELSERNQRGVNSRSYVPGPHSHKQEPWLRDALALYADLMGDSQLQSRLKVDQ